MDHLKRVTDEFARQAPTFDVWIVNDPARTEPIRTVVRALAQAGRTAGMGLSVVNGRIELFHRWRLLTARKPLEH